MRTETSLSQVILPEELLIIKKQPPAPSLTRTQMKPELSTYILQTQFLFLCPVSVIIQDKFLIPFQLPVTTEQIKMGCGILPE